MQLRTLTLFVVAAITSCSMQVNAQIRGLIYSDFGFRIVDGGETFEVTAIRSDIIRVRVYRNGEEPENTSFAVLDTALHSAIRITAEKNGFSTGKLHVSMGAHMQLTVKDNEGRLLQQDAAPILHQADGFRVYKALKDDEHFFGLGDKPGPLDRRGQFFTMWNTDHFGWQESSDPLYKDVPFFMDLREGRALGVFLNNTFRSSFDFGHELADEYSFGATGGAIDYFLMYGPTPKEVLASYAWLTGPTPLPPIWSLGFQQSRYTYSPESELIDVAHRMRSHKIPCDVLWLDIDFQRDNMPFTVDAERFPAFPQLVKNLSADRFKLVVITDLHVARQPGVGYEPYDSGIRGDHFLRRSDGSLYIGEVWPGPSVFPDFTRMQTQEWWGSLYRQFVDDGVAGFWNDMNEPAVFNTPSKTMPDDVQHRIEMPGFRKRVADHREVHNVYGMLNSKATHDGLLNLRPDQRPFVMTRASFAGGQRYAVTWTGDNSSTWNQLRMATPQLLNLGLSGFSMAGADVGGFAGSPSPELLTKWLEIAAFQPIDRDHSAKGTRRHEVWVDGPEQEDIRRRYIEERYKLLPYLYTTAEQTSHTGVPLMRPLFVEFPAATSDGHPIDFDAGDSEFMVGSDLLVAPTPSPDEIAPYEVHLPPGTWYDYWTGQRFERIVKTKARDLEQRDKVIAVEPIIIKPELSVLPVYARGGSIIPIGRVIQSTEEKLTGPLTLRVYPATDRTAPCGGEVYADDGQTFAFQRGSYARIHFSCSLGSDGSLIIRIDPQEGRFSPWWDSYHVEVVGWRPTQKIAIGATKQYPLTLDGDKWTVTIPATAKGEMVRLL